MRSNPMTTYIVPNRFFIFPTHVGKLLRPLQKKTRFQI